MNYKDNHGGNPANPSSAFQPAEELSKEDFQAMLLDKQRELTAVLEEKARLMAASAKLVEEKNKMAARALKVHEENALLQASPELAVQIAEMDFHLRMAEKFTAAGAFPKMTPEQCFTIMKAGAEMDMKPVEALNSLYIVNGQINPHGKAMPARIKKFGYQIEYLNETPQGCDVRVWNDEGLDVTEHVDANDPILKHKSTFMKIHPRYKMRYHGLRAIINFHIPHIFISVSDMFAEPVKQIMAEQGNGLNIAQVEESKERQRILRHIEKSGSLPELQKVSQYVGEYQLAEEYEAKFNQLSDEITQPEYEQE